MLSTFVFFIFLLFFMSSECARRRLRLRSKKWHAAKAIQKYMLNDTTTHSQADAFCASKGLRLCSLFEACPDGILKSPAGGPIEGDHWLALIDSPNSWSPIGSLGEGPCKEFTYEEGGQPGCCRSRVWCCAGKLTHEAQCMPKGTKNEKVVKPLAVWSGVKKGTPRLFCMIYTTSDRMEKIQAQVKGWAHRCDKYIFMGDKNIPEIQMIKVDFEGPKTYANMWQKTHAMWKYAVSHELNNFDYFYICGDDVFMIVENLRQYLLSAEVMAMKAKGKGMYIGHRLNNNGNEIFNAGGPGYVLDSVAASELVRRAHSVGLDVTPVEDVKVGMALNLAGVEPLHTEDGVSQRFHLFAPDFYLDFDPSKEESGWVVQGEINLKPGFVRGQAGISNKSIAFHYCSTVCLNEMAKLVYSCKKEPVALLKQ